MHKSIVCSAVVSILAFSANTFAADEIVSFSNDSAHAVATNSVAGRPVTLSPDQMKKLQKENADAKKNVDQLATDLGRTYNFTSANLGSDQKLLTLLTHVKEMQQEIGVCSIDNLMKAQHQVDADLERNQRDLNQLSDETYLKQQMQTDPAMAGIRQLVQRRDNEIAEAKKLLVTTRDAYTRGVIQDTIDGKEYIRGSKEHTITFVLNQQIALLEQRVPAIAIKRKDLQEKQKALLKKKEALSQCNGTAQAFVSKLTDMKSLELNPQEFNPMKKQYDATKINDAWTNMNAFLTESGTQTPATPAPPVRFAR